MPDGGTAIVCCGMGSKTPGNGKKSAVDATLKAMAFGSFIGRGQICAASTRMLVHNSILDEKGPVISAKKFQTTETLVLSALADE
ncbi:uncharacterized protein BBA_02723 [Beauveria bassiana ARSEF 2860]|uniref:Aldehyde dehydrogenase domain-containing protein n=1 Tax=Beauveria bassiana (strain ARSEF 2860) TaxID=655819 RepID=J5K3U7_BEAB2|nr:uncharacterized protein BBA_02723 [Beauveria bassiana ARSEF 2860]EJP68721.1 hypothetical protein BBA_02723 [Beauveria bassiana ARSEF 2860]